MNHGVVLFQSTSLALRAERVCQRVGLVVKLIPTPRQISSNCGTALRFEWADREEIETALGEAGVDFEGFHQLKSRAA